MVDKLIEYLEEFFGQKITKVGKWYKLEASFKKDREGEGCSVAEIKINEIEENEK